MSISKLAKCAVCGKEMSVINNRHLAAHGLSAEEYRATYPDSPLMSEAASAKRSEKLSNANASRKGKPRTDAERAAISEGMAKGKSTKGIKKGPQSETTKAKISAKSKDYYANHAHPLLGKSRSDETKQKIAQGVAANHASKKF